MSYDPKPPSAQPWPYIYKQFPSELNLEPHYSKHMSAMTAEGLHSKADIAAELAVRDLQIATLKATESKKFDEFKYEVLRVDVANFKKVKDGPNEIMLEGWRILLERAMDLIASAAPPPAQPCTPADMLKEATKSEQALELTEPIAEQLRGIKFNSAELAATKKERTHRLLDQCDFMRWGDEIWSNISTTNVPKMEWRLIPAGFCGRRPGTNIVRREVELLGDITMVTKLVRADEPEAITRASGDTLCSACFREYRKHPFSEHRDSNGEPFLNRLCGGRLVKL